MRTALRNDDLPDSTLAQMFQFRVARKRYPRTLVVGRKGGDRENIKPGIWRRAKDGVWYWRSDLPRRS